MKKVLFIPAIALLFYNFAGAADITDSHIGYSIQLPDNWIITETSQTQHLFEDTSGTYQSMIAIVKYDFSTETVFSSANDWTRANFISYAFSVDADPFSALVFYDTVDARQNEVLWAADAFSEFFSIDTSLSDWAEYIRFTASGTNGYELYAIGPLEDMELNIGYYLAIIESINLTTSPDDNMVHVTIPNRSVQNPVQTASGVIDVYNLLGRSLRTTAQPSLSGTMLLYRTPQTVNRRISVR